MFRSPLPPEGNSRSQSVGTARYDRGRRLGGALADRYRIERELGASVMATVFLAHDVRHDRKVAVKILEPDFAAVIGVQRFLAEIKTHASLQHPHILSLFDSGEVEGSVFYVMPFVDGGSLRRRLEREKQLPIDAALRIAGEVADALQHAHQHGIIHRDVKPENILLLGGHALVADFRITRAAPKTDTAEMDDWEIVGAVPRYISPEEAMGERELDARSDVYALGCVTYEMLTGAPPFLRILTTDPAPIFGARRKVPPAVEAAVLTALETLPADRWESALAFAQALGGEHSAG